MTFDPNRLALKLEQEFPEIRFAYLFGSAQEGEIRPGGDLDLAVWVSDSSLKLELIPRLVDAAETVAPGVSCDLVFLNDVGVMLAFEVLQGRILFIRPEARDLHAGFYSLTCREYEDQMAWMKKQLYYRNYDVQWSD